eukprot:tig00001049_g6680.t1
MQTGKNRKKSKIELTSSCGGSLLALLRRAAEAGNPSALLSLSLIYEHGSPLVSRSIDKAIELAMQAAEQGDAAACCRVGRLLRSVGGRNEEAFRFVKLAAMKESIEAALLLAELYDGGIGTEPDYRAAGVWLLKAHQQASHCDDNDVTPPRQRRRTLTMF